MRAKAAQEKLIEESGAPYSIVRATQFFEFVANIAASATDGDVVRLPHALIQPIAADGVATAVTHAVIGSPLKGATEIAGPEAFGMDDFIRTGLAVQGDVRQVVTDPRAPYFGAIIDDASIVPGPGATIFETRFADWLVSHVANVARQWRRAPPRSPTPGVPVISAIELRHRFDTARRRRRRSNLNRRLR